MHDIAYKIVNVMAHYDIAKSDRPLYEIWDLATEIETMSLAEIEKSGKCDEMIRLSKKSWLNAGSYANDALYSPSSPRRYSKPHKVALQRFVFHASE